MQSNGDCTDSGPTAQQLGYDNEGWLVTWQNAPSSPTSTASEVYDGEGNRVLQQDTTNGTTTTTTYVGNLEEVGVTGSNTTTTTYYYLQGHRLALAVNGTLSYLASDLLCSAEVALNTSGTATASVQYGLYDSVRSTNGAMPADDVFTGQHGDATTGLDDYGARYYDPVVGQFTSADSAAAGGLNRYAYVGDDPETDTDPTGHLLTCGPGGCGGGGDDNNPPSGEGEPGAGGPSDTGSGYVPSPVAHMPHLSSGHRFRLLREPARHRNFLVLKASDGDGGSGDQPCDTVCHAKDAGLATANQLSMIAWGAAAIDAALTLVAIAFAPEDLPFDPIIAFIMATVTSIGIMASVLVDEFNNEASHNDESWYTQSNFDHFVDTAAATIVAVFAAENALAAALSRLPNPVASAVTAGLYVGSRISFLTVGTIALSGTIVEGNILFPTVRADARQVHAPS